MANRHKPTWNQIVAFNAAVHSGSISKAAKYLGVTQPAVTSQVRSIERQFNVKLFTRSAAGVELTAQGIKLFAATNGATEIECAAREALSDSMALAGHVLRIGASAPQPVMTYLAAFKKLFPNVEIELNFGRWIDVVSAVRESEADIGFTLDPPMEKQFFALPVIQQRMVALIPDTFAIARKYSVSVRDLAKYPLLFGSPGSLIRELLEKRFLELGLNVEPPLELDDRDAFLEAAAAGLAISCVFELAAARRRSVVVRPITDFAPIYEHVFCLSRSRKRILVVKFFEVVDDCIARGILPG